MRRLILGAALLALTTPALSQSYDQYRDDGRSSYNDSRDWGGYRDDRDIGRDRDGDGDYDLRDRYLAQQRDEYRDDRDDRDDRRDRDNYRQSSHGLVTGGYLPRGFRASWIANPWKYNLPAAPRGTHWIIVRHDALLIRNNDSRILRVARNSV